MGKTFINEGDDIIIEEPAYLGAIQAFSIFKPRYNPVVLTEEGMDLRQFKICHVCPQTKTDLYRA